MKQAETAVHDSVTSVTTKKQSAPEAFPLVKLGVKQNAAPQKRQRKPSSFRYGLFRFLRIVNIIFSGLLRVFLIVLAGIVVVILVVYVVAVVSSSRFNLFFCTQVRDGHSFWRCSSQWCNNDVGIALLV